MFPPTRSRKPAQALITSARIIETTGNQPTLYLIEVHRPVRESAYSRVLR